MARHICQYIQISLVVCWSVLLGEGWEGGKVIERESHNLIMPQKAGRNGKTIFWLRHSASSWSNVRGVCVLHELLQLEGMRWKSIVKSMKTIFTAGLWRGEAFFLRVGGKELSHLNGFCMSAQLVDMPHDVLNGAFLFGRYWSPRSRYWIKIMRFRRAFNFNLPSLW